MDMHDPAVSFQDGDGMICAVCLALTRRVGRQTGVEFRYIRSSGFLMSQPSLAKLLISCRVSRNAGHPRSQRSAVASHPDTGSTRHLH